MANSTLRSPSIHVNYPESWNGLWMIRSSYVLKLNLKKKKFIFSRWKSTSKLKGIIVIRSLPCTSETISPFVVPFIANYCNSSVSPSNFWKCIGRQSFWIIPVFEEVLRISRESLDPGRLTFSWQVSDDSKFDRDVYTPSPRVNFP